MTDMPGAIKAVQKAFDEQAEQLKFATKQADAMAREVERITGKEFPPHSNIDCPWVDALEALQEIS